MSRLTDANRFQVVGVWVASQAPRARALASTSDGQSAAPLVGGVGHVLDEADRNTQAATGEGHGVALHIDEVGPLAEVEPDAWTSVTNTSPDSEHGAVAAVELEDLGRVVAEGRGWRRR